MWFDSESEGEGETANIVMEYSESGDEFNSEELAREDLLAAYNLVLTKLYESCLSSYNLEKTINSLRKESEEGASTITILEKHVSSLNSIMGNLIQIERNLKRSSNLLDGLIEVEDMKEMEIASEKVIYYERKIEVLMLDHMLLHRAHYVGSHQRRSKKHPLICQYCGKLDIQGLIASKG